MTLVELLVVLAILGLMSAAAGLSMPNAQTPVSDPWRDEIAGARRRALRDAVAVSIAVEIGDSVHAATALPDGSMVADRALSLDRLTGRPEGEGTFGSGWR